MYPIGIKIKTDDFTCTIFFFINSDDCWPTTSVPINFTKHTTVVSYVKRTTCVYGNIIMYIVFVKL